MISMLGRFDIWLNSASPLAAKELQVCPHVDAPRSKVERSLHSR